MNEQTIMSDLAAFADSDRHTKFRLLQTWQEYVYYLKVRRATEAVIKFLKKSAKVQIKSYCKDVVSGNSDVFKLLAYRYIIKIINCYEAELRIVQEMLDEYECYLFAGNWLDFLFNTRRPTDKLYDHRGD